MTPRIHAEEHLLTEDRKRRPEAFHAAGLPAEKLRAHAIPDQFVEHSPQAIQRANLKLDAAGVVETVFALYPELARPAAPGGNPAATRKEEKLVETVTW
jgi:hypothetical protein